MIKYSLVLFLFIFHTMAFGNELCEEKEGFLEQLENAVTLPKVTANYLLNENCQYTVKTTSEMASSKSLADFMVELTSEETNFASSDKDRIKSYKIKKITPNNFEQTVKASKHGVTATIINTCTTNIASEKAVVTCHLKDGGGFVESNTTIITCSNATKSTKKCEFLTKGKARPYSKLGITLKGPCDLAAGGAAETVKGVFRLSQYISHGNVDESKWNEPGTKFYNEAKSIQDKRPGSYTQVIH